MSYPPQPPHVPPPGPQHDPWQHTPPPTGYGLPGQPRPLPPPLPPGKRNNTPLIIGVVAAAVVLVIGCCVGAALLGGDEQPEGASATGTPTAGPANAVADAPTTVAVEPSTAAPASAAPKPAGPRTVAMPKVTGKNAAVADDELRKLGFTRIRYGSQDEDDTVVLLLSNWTVTKQSQKAGAKVKTDTLIVLTCTKQS
jgi:hypothetical protein